MTGCISAEHPVGLFADRTRHRVWCLALVVLCGGALTASAQPYSATRNGEVVQLEDARSQTIVSILPSVGNIAFEMKVKGHDVLRWPYASVEEFKARPALSGIPFVGPWANRLDEQAFYANGKRYPFDMELGNVRGAIPIHGFLTDHRSLAGHRGARRTADAAWVTSRLEFFRQPAWMKQWPFAHTIELTYRLENGALEVRTAITNLSDEADAGRNRVPSLLPVDRFAAQRVDRFDRRADALAARADQGADRRNRTSRYACFPNRHAVGARRLQSRRCVLGSGARCARVAPRCR